MKKILIVLMLFFMAQISYAAYYDVDGFPIHVYDAHGVLIDYVAPVEEEDPVIDDPVRDIVDLNSDGSGNVIVNGDATITYNEDQEPILLDVVEPETVIVSECVMVQHGAYLRLDELTVHDPVTGRDTNYFDILLSYETESAAPMGSLGIWYYWTD